MKKFLSILGILILLLLLNACSSKTNPPTNNDNDIIEDPSNNNDKEDNPKEELKNIIASLSDLTITYDGNSHELTINETLDSNIIITYTNNRQTDAGIYNVQASLSGEGYNPLILNATLTILKADISNITFKNKTVEYDDQNHYLEIVGNLPAESIVKYYYNGEEKDAVKEVGTYEVIAHILESKNYNEKRYTASLNIISSEEQLYSAVIGNKIYFQNNLDKNKLYVSNNNTITKINDHTPEYLFTYNNKLYYYNKSLFSKDIVVYDGSTSSSLFSTKGEYLTTDGTYIYYAINNFLFNTSENGIYKISINNPDNPIKLTSTKASYLVYHNNFIYFANNNDGGKLYKISTFANNSDATLLWEEKVEYITTDANNLYFNSTKQVIGIGLASAIYKFELSTGKAIKLSTDSGKYLTIVANSLYYINNDKITSRLFGDGIYKLDTNKSSDHNLPGIKVLSADDNAYSSLTSDGANLYYYKLSDKHFYKYTISLQTETDLMASYQVEETINLSNYVDIKEYGGEIFYINPLENGALYKYNPITKAKIKVLNENISNITFYNNYLYYSTYFLTNYALFRMDLETYETIKVSSDRTDQLIFEDNKIYYIKVGSLYNNYLYSMDLDGGNNKLIQNTDNLWVKTLIKDGNTFYYARNPKIYSENLSSYTIGDAKPFDFGVKARIVTLYNNDLYYYNQGDKTISAISKNNQNRRIIVTNVEINSMIIDNNILYYSSTAKNHFGLYAYDLNSKSETKISSNVGDGLLFTNNRLYFIQTAINYINDYPKHSIDGVDGHLYYYDGINTKKA